MNGLQLATVLRSMVPANRKAALKNELDAEDYPETLRAGLELVSVDLDILSGCRDSKELQDAIVAEATKQGGEYARLRYTPGAMLDADDPKYVPDAGGGLSFVCFGDLWAALETFCQ